MARPDFAVCREATHGVLRRQLNRLARRTPGYRKSLAMRVDSLALVWLKRGLNSPHRPVLGIPPFPFINAPLLPLSVPFPAPHPLLKPPETASPANPPATGPPPGAWG